MAKNLKMPTMKLMFIACYIQLKFSEMTLINSDINFDQKCVVILANQNKYILYRKFYYLQDRCIHFKNNQIQKTNIAVLVETISDLNLSNCTLVTALDHHQWNLLSVLIQQTHIMVPDYAMASDSILQKLTNTYETNCSQTKHIYIQAIAMLTQHLSVKLVSIIVEDNKCELDFANSLADEIRKSRAEEHSSVFQVRVYKVKYNETGSVSQEILRSIQKENFDMRAFVMLTPLEITSTFFEVSANIAMNQLKDIWIVKHGKYKNEIIPFQTMTFSEMKHREYKPIYGNVAQNILTTSPERFNSICSFSADNSSLSMMMEKYGFFNETKDTIVINVWWESSWKTLHEIKPHQQMFSISPHIGKSNFLGAVGINQVLKIVSVIEGPFLFTSDYRFDSDQGKCEQGSLTCRIPIMSGNDTQWQYTCCYGYTVDLIAHLAELLGFQHDLYIVEDGKYGGYDKELGTFNGMIGDVYNEKAIMAVAGLTVNSDRTRYVDFTEPFMRAEIGIVTSKHITIPKYMHFDFIETLGSKIKYSIAVMFLLAIMFIWALENFVIYQCRKYEKMLLGHSNKMMYSWQDSFTYTSGLMFQRGIGGVSPSTKAGRTMGLCLTIAMVAFVTLYAASLTADRVVQYENNKFTGLKDERMTNPTDKFKFATSADTSIEAFFKNAPDETLNRMYRFMLKYNEKILEDGLEKVLSGELQAYLNEYPFMEFFIAQYRYRTLEIHENTVGQTSYGIAVSKNSYIKSILSRAILHMREYDELSNLRKKWLTIGIGTTEPAINQFSLYFFATPLLMLAGVIVLCFFILIGEIITWKYFTKNKEDLVEMEEDMEETENGSSLDIQDIVN